LKRSRSLKSSTGRCGNDNLDYCSQFSSRILGCYSHSPTIARPRERNQIASSDAWPRPVPADRNPGYVFHYGRQQGRAEPGREAGPPIIGSSWGPSGSRRTECDVVEGVPNEDLRSHTELKSSRNLDADHFVIGGPIHNDYADQLIESRQATAGVNAELIFDANKRYIKFGQAEFGPDLDLELVNNVPKLDYGIVMLTRIRRGTASYRVLLAAGLTTYGTHAAAHFAAHRLASYIKNQHLGRSANVCVLIKARLVNGEPYDLEAIANISGGLLPS
jgi:hypothetical protein